MGLQEQQQPQHSASHFIQKDDKHAGISRAIMRVLPTSALGKAKVAQEWLDRWHG
jgi:hypothetical protein